MKWLELLNMEYGECVVLGGGDRSLLMVDCGSVSQKLREGDVPLDAWLETIAARYEPAMERWFLLTHFHRDHLSGFQKLLESREGYFSRVFLPRAPVDSHGVPLLLEYALFAYLFAQPQSDAFQVNTWCVKAFRTLEQRLGQDRIFTLGAGDVFHGAYVVGLLRGLSPKEAARLATGVSCIKCTRIGGRAGIPDWDTVQKYLQTGEIDYTEIDQRVEFYGRKLQL